MVHGDSVYAGAEQQLMKNTLQIVTLFALLKMRVVRPQMA